MKNEKRLNMYHCRECGTTVTTVDMGTAQVTPMLIFCKSPKCDQLMASMMYNVPEYLTPKYAWFGHGKNLKLKKLGEKLKESYRVKFEGKSSTKSPKSTK